MKMVYVLIEEVIPFFIKWFLRTKVFFILKKIARGWRYSLWKARLGSFGRASVIHPHVVILFPENVYIGNNVGIAEFVHIRGAGGVYIGDDSLIATHATITSVTHDTEVLDGYFRNTSKLEPVVIGKNVWIGSGAIILPGVNIGEGSIVGAGSVITHDVPSHVIVVGAPGRIIKQLDFN
jgi:maltose O-acetyltransferase